MLQMHEIIPGTIGSGIQYQATMKTSAKLSHPEVKHLEILDHYGKRWKIGTISQTIVRLVEDYPRIEHRLQIANEMLTAMMERKAGIDQAGESIAKKQAELIRLEKELSDLVRRWMNTPYQTRIDAL